MKVLIVLFAIFCLSFAAPIFRDGKIQDDSKVPVKNEKLVNFINKLNTSWKAGHNEMWNDWSVARAKKLMGAHLYTAMDEPRISHSEIVIKALPPSFDSRTNWPKCPTIGTILNQAECGSCWAFGCIESISDRFCIFSNASINIPLSEMDLVTCDNQQGGCEGGDPYSAWSWVASEGIVSAACSPYTIPTCPPAQQPCLNFVNTPNCVKQCSDSENWSSSKKYVKSYYYVSSNQNDIAAEIVQNGPVEAAFSVYEDFVHYKSGVYVHKTGSYLGGHAVKIIGYGTESGLPYWLVVNSWTTYWGDQGLFKIVKGRNECGIESGIVGGAPKI